jgi:hypothetical protein
MVLVRIANHIKNNSYKNLINKAEHEGSRRMKTELLIQVYFLK